MKIIRHARERSSTGIYHIIVRGLDRQVIFLEDLDYYKYLNIVRKKALDHGSVILGYCLMDNHVHLLVNEGKGTISDLMRSIGVSYASWFNNKYDRTGYLFQNRFHSECIENDPYLLTVIRYIHLNPVKAEIVQSPQDYRWSSCKIYFGKDHSDIINADFILGLFSEERIIAQKRFRDFMQQANQDHCLDTPQSFRKSDKQIYTEILKILGNMPINDLKVLSKEERDAILRDLKSIEGSSIRQIARLIDLGYKIVYNA